EEGKPGEWAWRDEPAGAGPEADSAVPIDDFDGLYRGILTMRAAGHPGTIAIRVSHGVGSGTQIRPDCGAAPVSLRISSSGSVSGMMLVFGSTCLRTELAIGGPARPAKLTLRPCT